MWDWRLRVAEDPDLRYVNGPSDVMQIIDSVGDFIPPYVLGNAVTLLTTSFFWEGVCAGTVGFVTGSHGTHGSAYDNKSIDTPRMARPHISRKGPPRDSRNVRKSNPP
jgi:hypothetical protein